MQGLHDAATVAEMIKSGRQLMLAADEALLAALPKGNWIGGTIPYFMGAEGGLHSASRIFVTEMPAGADVTIRRYDADSLASLAGDHPGHGFTLLLLPAFTKAHTAYAQNVTRFPGIFDRPVVGWVSGVALGDIGKVTPKTFDGITGTGSDSAGVAMHVVLPESAKISVDILNLFEQGEGDRIEFSETGFTVSEAIINGTPGNFAQYLTEHATDTKLPLVADYNGAMVNAGIQQIDSTAGTVSFYGPVFPNVVYRVAKPVEDYIASFHAKLPPQDKGLTFSCNCVLNYFYAGLEGRSTAPLSGPMTFGEIAYMLLNQTAVYLTVEAG